MFAVAALESHFLAQPLQHCNNPENRLMIRRSQDVHMMEAFSGFPSITGRVVSVHQICITTVALSLLVCVLGLNDSLMSLFPVHTRSGAKCC